MVTASYRQGFQHQPVENRSSVLGLAADLPTHRSDSHQRPDPSPDVDAFTIVSERVVGPLPTRAPIGASQIRPNERRAGSVQTREPRTRPDRELANESTSAHRQRPVGIRKETRLTSNGLKPTSPRAGRCSRSLWLTRGIHVARTRPKRQFDNCCSLQRRLYITRRRSIACDFAVTLFEQPDVKNPVPPAFDDSGQFVRALDDVIPRQRNWQDGGTMTGGSRHPGSNPQRSRHARRRTQDSRCSTNQDIRRASSRTEQPSLVGHRFWLGPSW